MRLILRDLAALAAVMSVLTWGTAAGQAADPFRTRNLSPPLAIFALPTWQPVPDETVFALTTEVANHYRLSRRGADRLILDGETLRGALHFERPFGRGWSAALELPFYRQSGGSLDDLIDGWHSVFGMPDGGRNNRPEDALLFEMASASRLFYRLNESASGPGDLSLSVARELGRDSGYVVRGTLKLPTGDESLLAGSGSADWMLTLMRSRDVALSRRAAGYYWGFGILGVGGAEQVRFAGEDFAALAVAGGGLAIRQRLGVKAQIEVHTALYETPLEELGQTAVQASIGGWWDLSGPGRLEFAVSEDLHVSTTPDVVLHVQLSWRW